MVQNYGVRKDKNDGQWTTILGNREKSVVLAQFDSWQEAFDYMEIHKQANKKVHVADPVARSMDRLRVKGVGWSPTAKKWRAIGRLAGQVKTFGYFDTPEEARAAYEQGNGIPPGDGLPALAIPVAGLDGKYRITPNGQIWDAERNERIAVTNGRFRAMDVAGKRRILSMGKMMRVTFGQYIQEECNHI